MLYLPVACPGSGKSFLAEKMVQFGVIKPDAIVSPDSYRKLLTGDVANQDVNGPVFRIVDTIVDNRIRFELDVYLDATNLNSKLRDKLLNRVFAIDPDLEVTILISSIDRAKTYHRNVTREHPVPDDVFDRFWDGQNFFQKEQVLYYKAKSNFKVETIENFLEKL